MRSEKSQITDGIEVPNQERMRTRKGKLQVCGNIASRHHQTNRDEEKNKKRVSQTKEQLLETKDCNRNLIKGINTWTVPLVRYSGPFLKWTG